LLMLIQVPLKVRTMRQQPPAKAMEAPPAPPSAAAGLAARDREAMETAVLGHGPELGPFVELDGKTIARDPRFPVRVTVQFYQATATGTLTRPEVARLAQQIRKVYKEADYVGSLVVPTGRDRERPTVWSGYGTMPAGVTWASFAGLVERFTSAGTRP